MAAFFYMAKRRRTIVYVDGFNLYYGAVRGTPHKWLNLHRMFAIMRQADELVAIRYFTALISGPTRPNQDAFLQALSTLPLVHVHLGRFSKERVRCEVKECSHSIEARMFRRVKEKATDVNIAIMMLDDAYRNECDNLVLVSGDSDLVPAVRMVRQRFPEKRVIVYVPSGGDPERAAAVELRSAATDSRNLPNNLLPVSQFPAEISDGFGGVIRKPQGW